MLIDQMVVPRKLMLVAARAKSLKTNGLAPVVAEAAKKLLG